jgi:hypothetical protein
MNTGLVNTLASPSPLFSAGPSVFGRETNYRLNFPVPFDNLPARIIPKGTAFNPDKTLRSHGCRLNFYPFLRPKSVALIDRSRPLADGDRHRPVFIG